MLMELLRRLAQGGVHTTASLARELGVSRGLLASMTEELARMGYLQVMGGGCQGKCGACSLAAGCSVSDLGSVWVLTEKGMCATDKEC